MQELRPYFKSWKPQRIFNVSASQRKPGFPAKITPVLWLSWDPGPESLVSNSGKSQWCGSLLKKSMDYHVESGETEIEGKSIFVMLMIVTSEAVWKDKVINFSNTGTRVGGSRKSNSKVVRTSVCLFFCAWWDLLNLIDESILKLVLITFAYIALWQENKRSAQVCVCLLFFSVVVEILFMLVIFYYSREYFCFFFSLTVVST